MSFGLKTTKTSKKNKKKGGKQSTRSNVGGKTTPHQEKFCLVFGFGLRDHGKH